MSEQRVKRIEFVKTLILVVLFFTTILFLYLLWSLDSESTFRLPSILSQEEVEPPQIEALLIPKSVIYSQGDGSYKLAAEDLDQSFYAALSELRTLGNSDSVLVSEVTAQQYQEAIAGYQSVIISFDYGLPFNEVCSHYDINRATGFDTVEFMNSISFSEAAKESIFIYDQKKDRYYRLVADKESTVVEDQFLSIQDELLTSYYTIGNISGGDNTALIPLAVSSNLIPVEYYEESEEASENVRQALAESLFGENFDFVRRITDSFGNVTYMYGYGQKTFFTGIDGVFEYKNATVEGISAGFFGDLETALSFVAMHGTWSSLDGQAIEFYLKNVQDIADERKKGYHFSFGVKILGQEVFYENGESIEIEILAGQVAYYKRDVISVAPEEAYDTAPKPTQDPANVIAQNCNHIYNVMNDSMLTINSEEAFEYVADSVVSVQTGLVRVQNDQNLQPAWIIHMNNDQRFYFSLYEARPIGLSE